MARYAILENGVVTNFAEADAAFAADQDEWIAAGPEVQVGWAYSGGSFVPPVIPLPAQKLAKRAELAAKVQALFLGGFTPSSGPLAGKTLQVRDVEDRTNWLASQAAYSSAVAAGNGAVAGASFRTAANETVECTYLEGLVTLLAMAAWGKAVMGNSWAIKDAIAAAADEEVLNAIDIEAGWP